MLSDSISLTPIPATAGIGLKAAHYNGVLETRPSVGFFEVHTENYMGAGGPTHHYLEAIAEHYPLSMHGVGLSLGSADALDRDHLRAVREVVDRYNPALVSEHLSWSFSDGIFLNDLLELPLTQETLNLVTDHVSEFQDTLGRKVLIENPSSYLAYVSNGMSEPDFLNELTGRSGCGLLLDVNNVYVSSRNLDFSPEGYIDAIAPNIVGEIHLAGHSVTRHAGHDIHIDDHGSPVSDAVWDLYARALGHLGAIPSLIEWDTDVPDLSVLLGEASKADKIRNEEAAHASAA
ncbi:MAG: MNIO family bufferin maturase [Alphaproteobacteria bacterium]